MDDKTLVRRPFSGPVQRAVWSGLWHCFPSITEGGSQRIKVRTPDGYDFAELTWATCSFWE
ncbi:hypothetical protein [Streptomyces sp. NPDC085540]|uniref:hypothetical protein n=1 Tax=Streptomyces sp. NPDC085540 TaxID=3365730 RepID=UPI0037D4AE8C